MSALAKSGLDPDDVACVKNYIEHGKRKPTDTERIAFNEGVMCAAFALGAYIDAHEHRSAEAAVVLQAAYRALLGIRQLRLP